MNKSFNVKFHFRILLKWLSICVILGILCGALGAFFSQTIIFLTTLRQKHFWLIALLPLAGVASVLLYRLCRVSGMGTHCVFDSLRSKKVVPVSLVPAVFIGSALTHMCGGSAGREGAALQLGGGTSTLVLKIFRLNEDEKNILSICGMGAVFSAVFGTPLGAAVFAVEVVRKRRVNFKAILPTLLSSIIAYIVALGLKAKPERFGVSEVPTLKGMLALKVFVIIVLGAFISILFCEGLHKTHALFKRFFKNEYIRIAVGGILIVALTVLVGTYDYNGGGIDVIEGIFHGEGKGYEAFALKILFTVITVGAGYKGGEIVPTLFIGATFGGSAAVILDMPLGLGAVIGIAALFSGVTNCPIATIVLCYELFSGKAIIYIVFAAIISYLISGNSSLYTEEKFSFKKFGVEE